MQKVACWGPQPQVDQFWTSCFAVCNTSGTYKLAEPQYFNHYHEGLAKCESAYRAGVELVGCSCCSFEACGIKPSQDS